jgi:hypothetical protein
MSYPGSLRIVVVVVVVVVIIIIIIIISMAKIPYLEAMSRNWFTTWLALYGH